MDATLVFSFVGMTSQEVKVQGKSVFNVVLEEETKGLGRSNRYRLWYSQTSGLFRFCELCENGEFDGRFEPKHECAGIIKRKCCRVEYWCYQLAAGGDSLRWKFVVRIR